MPNDIPRSEVTPDLKYQNTSKSKGILLSNEIDRLCKADVLIRRTHYKPENLRPAAYTLTIGRDYVDSKGIFKRMKPSEKFFYMEPNSIVFVTTAEELNLPFYIVARFNLRVQWVYRGILLGTGPQVDPGFQGTLSCPLFNLTDRSMKISLGEPFATIDFEHTTDFFPNMNAEQLEYVRKRAESNEPDATFNNTTHLLFTQKPFKPLQKLPDHDVISSLAKMSDEVKTWRAIGVGTVLAFFGLTLTLLNSQNNLYQQLRTASERVVVMENDIKSMRANSNVTPVPQPSPSPTPKNSERREIR
jgi:deoxycytidine triphosphate deaminase